MSPSTISAECLGQIIGWLGNDLVRVAPQNLALARRRDRTHRQTTLLDQPRAVACTADRFLGIRIKPADAPDRVASLEMPANSARKRQVLIEPVELALQFAMNPVRAAGMMQIPGRMEEACLHPAVRVDQRCYEPHIHDDTRGDRSHRVPFAQIRDAEDRPSAASGHGRRETSGEMHNHAFHRCLRGVSVAGDRRVANGTHDGRTRADTMVELKHQGI